MHNTIVKSFLFMGIHLFVPHTFASTTHAQHEVFMVCRLRGTTSLEYHTVRKTYKVATFVIVLYLEQQELCHLTKYSELAIETKELCWPVHVDDSNCDSLPTSLYILCDAYKYVHLILQ